MFLQASVCPQGGWGCLPQCMLGYQPPEQTPPSRADTPLGADTLPGAVTPPARDTPTGADTHPPLRYGHCCGWYASYWNAFLLNVFFLFSTVLEHLLDSLSNK